jgi:SAM-dependent methyltransferase
MSHKDRGRWDAKWSAMEDGIGEPHVLLERYGHLFSGGDALDLACGRGQNSFLLARSGYRVLAVDVSPVALNSARQAAEQRCLNEKIQFRQVDLDEWVIPTESFDLTVVFRFLDRNLFPAIKHALRSGGGLLYSTRNSGVLEREPDTNPAYLLQPGELGTIFGDWEIIFYEDGEVDSSIVVRKPG